MKQELIDADLAFSELSREQGMNHAFISYCAEDGWKFALDTGMKAWEKKPHYNQLVASLSRNHSRLPEPGFT